MAGSYTAKIKFQSDTSSLNKMEKDLSGRFSRITNRFKQGIKSVGKVLTIGGAIPAVIGIITSLLDPISALNSKLNETLDRADDIGDRAQTLGTSVSKYAALTGALQMQGLDTGNIDMMISSITQLLGDAKAGKKNVLSEYAGETDIANVMYKVVESIRQISDPAEQARLLGDIFGSRMVAKFGGVMANGLDKSIKEISAGINWQTLDDSINKLGKLQDYQAGMQVNRQLRELADYSKIIDKNTLRKQQTLEEQKSVNLKQQMKSYDDLASINAKMEEFKNIMILGSGKVAQLLDWFLKYGSSSIDVVIQLLTKIASKNVGGKGGI